jgi:hypothetical protein
LVVVVVPDTLVVVVVGGTVVGTVVVTATTLVASYVAGVAAGTQAVDAESGVPAKMMFAVGVTVGNASPMVAPTAAVTFNVMLTVGAVKLVPPSIGPGIVTVTVLPEVAIVGVPPATEPPERVGVPLIVVPVGAVKTFKMSVSLVRVTVWLSSVSVAGTATTPSLMASVYEPPTVTVAGAELEKL